MCVYYNIINHCIMYVLNNQHLGLKQLKDHAFVIDSVFNSTISGEGNGRLLNGFGVLVL